MRATEGPGFTVWAGMVSFLTLNKDAILKISPEKIVLLSHIKIGKSPLLN